MARDVIGNKNRYYTYIYKKENEDKIRPLLNGAGDLVTKDMEKAEDLDAFFFSVF